MPYRYLQRGSSDRRPSSGHNARQGKPSKGPRSQAAVRAAQSELAKQASSRARKEPFAPKEDREYLLVLFRSTSEHEAQKIMLHFADEHLESAAGLKPRVPALIHVMTMAAPKGRLLLRCRVNATTKDAIDAASRLSLKWLDLVKEGGGDARGLSKMNVASLCAGI
jgi:hypothetical protein